MAPDVQALLARVQATPDFAYVRFDDINATNAVGDNALHCVVGWGDDAAAALLIAHGIDVNRHGEFGLTPLHHACSRGHRRIAQLLLEHGADPYARTEGEQPFMLAQRHRHGELCALLTRYLTVPDPAEPARNLSRHMALLDEQMARLEDRIARESAGGR